MLLEREHDLAVAEAALDAAVERHGGTLLSVEGPPGIGKTEFCSALVARARERDVHVLTATGGELERDLPFGVVRQLLGAVARLEPARVASSAAVALGLDLEATGPDTDMAEIHALEALQLLCVSLAAERPLLISVDDLHWVDSASVKFLLYLARRLTDLPVVLVVSVRQ